MAAEWTPPDYIIAMDAAGYSHKPLVRVDMTDSDVLDVLENFGLFDFAIDTRENLKHALPYACWMTDPDDLAIDNPQLSGTSCVIVNPTASGHFIANRHTHDGKWENVHGGFAEFDDAVRYVAEGAQWVNNDRKLLEKYRQHKGGKCGAQ